MTLLVIMHSIAPINQQLSPVFVTFLVFSTASFWVRCDMPMVQNHETVCSFCYKYLVPCFSDK